MDLSVVISSYNRASLLEQTLRSVVASGADVPFTWEIVVVDNNSTDDTRAVVERAARGDTRIRYAFEPRQGVSFGRNTGVEQSRGALILFTDDDILVDRRWLGIAYDAFKDPGITFIMGRILPLWPGPPPRWIPPPPLTGPLGVCDLGDVPLPVGRDSRDMPMTANMGVRRAVYLELGGLNTRLGPQGRAESGAKGYFSGEDGEFGLRLVEAGYRGLYVPDLVVHNHITPERATKKYFRRWMLSNGHAHAIVGEDRERHLPRWFGVPRFVFRRLLRNTVLCTWHFLRRRPGAAFRYELGLHFFIGFIAERWSGRQHSQGLPR